MNKLRSWLTPSRLLAAVEFVLIAGLAVYFRLPFWNVLPLLVSICVMFMQSRINRFAFLLGALNSVLYAVVWFGMTLYSSALYALLVSFPLQILTFVNWSRHTSRNTTETRSLSLRHRLFLFLGMAAVWLILFVILSAFGSAYLVLDNTAAVLGIVATLLCAGRYSEFTILQWLTNLAGVVTYTAMTFDDPSRCVWLLSSGYSLLCSIVTYINLKKKENQA